VPKGIYIRTEYHRRICSNNGKYGNKFNFGIRSGQIINCIVCNKKFYVYPYQIKTKKTCSPKCRSITRKGLHPWNKGLSGYKTKPASEERKIKIGLAHKGKIISEEARKRMSVSHIGKQVGINSPTWKGGKPKCIDCGQETATYEAIRCKECNNKFQFGQNSPGWKGGVTPLHISIRTSLENKIWIKSVFKKDNYTCQDCGISDGNGKAAYLEAHHIKEFNIIFQEFLQTYSQFSPIEDKETLVRLATTYQPFWDISNGKTLCEDCHDKIKHKVKELIKNE
jgi:hypothetical protein